MTLWKLNKIRREREREVRRTDIFFVYRSFLFLKILNKERSDGGKTVFLLV